MRFLYLLILWLLAGWVHGQETILDYQVDISIHSDSQIEVTETIKVRGEGQQIQRGIFRAIPTIRPDKSGRDEPAPITILSVQRDGQKEKYHLEKNRKSVVVYIGDESTNLAPGVYIYEIRYRADNQIGFFEEYDELYWNVIGHDWAFLIEQYEVTLHLPEGADFVQGSCYTGYPGSTTRECTLSEVGSGAVHAAGEQPLLPGEGFTVAVAWPKGYITESVAGSYELGWRNMLIFVGGIFLFLFYGYGAWKKVGVDPPEHAVVPDWHVPGDYSPAEISFLHHRTVTNEAVSAALVSAGVKKVIRIENTKKKFTFHRLSDSDPLEPEEKALIDRLLPPGKDTFVLKSSAYSRYQSAKGDFQSALKRKFAISDYYRQNWTPGIKAILLMAAITAIVLSIGMYPLMSNRLYSGLLTFVIALAPMGVIAVLFRIMKWYKWLFILPAWLVMTTIFVLIYSQGLFYTTSYIWVAVIIGLALLLTGMFNYLIYAPTPKGQKMSAAVKGFRMYLDKSEKSMLEYFTPPEKTPELFEKMLPFAIALGVENKWGQKFKQVLDDAIEKGTYAPIWYVGNIHQINSLHSNFQSSVSHAAPKSSSGSGGGGFSGGGGGGGGGGGW